MRLLNSNSATPYGTGQRRPCPGFRQALIFGIGAAVGSILATLIGLEYASWVIIAACWPIALLFGMLERPRERRPHIISVGRAWYAAARRASAVSSPDRPPLRPTGRGLRRVK